MKQSSKNLTMNQYLKKTTAIPKENNKKEAEQNLPKNENFISNLMQFFVACLLAVATFCTYFSSRSYHFQFDDLSNITKRFFLRTDNPLERWWSNPRWIGDWINSLNYKYGQFDPTSYRLTNIAIHIITGLIVFFFVLQLCKKINTIFFRHNRLLVATVVAGLFLLHPVQTQTTSYIIQGRVEGIASMLVLTLTLTFMLYRQTKNILAQFIYAIILAVVSLISCGSKEIIIVTPLLFILIDWFFIAEEKWEHFKKGLNFYLIYLPYFAFLVNHYFLHFSFLKEAVTLKMTLHNNSGNVLTESPTGTIYPLHFFISEFKVIVHYMLMYLWPAGICVEYDWTLASSFFSADVIIPGIFLSTLLYGALQAAYFRIYNYISAPILWFFICIAPRSTIIPSPELACDYKAYLASFGTLFIIGSALAWIINFLTNLPYGKAAKIFLNTPIKKNFAQLFCCSIFFAPICYATLSRNTIWSNNVDFWEDCAKKAPKKARTHNNYGVALCEAGRYKEAVIEYKKAIALDKDYHDPLSNIAVAYSMLNENDKAIEALYKAIKIHPGYPEAYNNLGSLYLQKNDLENAEKVLAVALKLRGWYGKAHYNVARLHELRGDFNQAWESLKKATEGDLESPEVFFKLGQTSLRIGKYEEGIYAFKKMFEKGSVNPPALFSLANCYYMLKKYDEAQELYEKLSNIDPKDYRYVYNQAEVFNSKQEYEKALPFYEKAAELSNNHIQVVFRKSNCLANLKKYDLAKNCLQVVLNDDQPHQIKEGIKNEIARLEIEAKVTEGKGSIQLTALKKALKERSS